MKFHGLLGIKAIFIVIALSAFFSYLNYKSATITELDVICSIGELISSDSAGRGGGNYVRLKSYDLSIELKGEVRMGSDRMMRLGENYEFCFVDNFSFKFIIPDSRGYIYFFRGNIDSSNFRQVVVDRSNYHERHGLYLNFFACLFFYFFVVFTLSDRERY